MPAAPSTGLDAATVITDHAAVAIRAQEILNHAHELSDGTPRMQIDRIEFSSDWGVSQSTGTTAQISLTPLNLSYRVSRKLTESTDVQLVVYVEQVPLPVGEAG